MAARRVVLRSITARLLWDGRTRGGGFIPGIAHFQAGILVLRRAGDVVAGDRLVEIDEALAKADVAVQRWARGLAAFAKHTLGEAGGERPAWADVEERRLRLRVPEAERLATLICAFDAACVATSAVTALAGARRVFNPHHASIAERARMVRRVADLGHAGGLLCREKLRMERGGRSRRRSRTRSSPGRLPER